MLRLSAHQRLPRAAKASAKANAVRALSSTAPRRADITLEVDGVPVTVPQGSALIQACEKAGATIPRFCYHDVSSLTTFLTRPCRERETDPPGCGC